MIYKKIEAKVSNLLRGRFDAFAKPIAYIRSGECLCIETVNPAGIIGSFHEFIEEKHMDKNDDIVQKMLEADLLPMPENNDHVLTGPIYIEKAMPGDTLEIEIQDIKVLGKFGNLDMIPGRGGLPEMVKHPRSFFVSFHENNTVGRMENHEFPLAPFFGIMAVAAPDSPLSIPPGKFGGNMDLKELKRGALVSLPVLVPGGMFYVGDGHAAQGDGEVCLSAVECCMEGYFRFTLKKDKQIETPRVENKDYYIALGFGKSLDEASHQAIKAAVKWIMEKENCCFEEAFALASVLVDLRITQVVNGIKGVHAMIPKKKLERI